MSYAPTPPPYEQPGYAPKKGKPWLLIVGGITLLLSLVLCGIGGFNVYGSMTDLTDKPMQTGSQTVALDEGETANVWARAGSGTTCSAVGPNGSTVSSDTSVSQTVSVGDKELERVMAFEATDGGDHTVTCTGDFVVGDGISVVGSVIAGIGSLLCCLGVVLGVVGLILWLVRKK